MGIFGPQEIEKFLKNLDERKILNLCADILYIDSHTDIRIMEGPGDGQRDIHSIDPNGEKCLTQSKFHSNLSYTVSAKELGEVVLGMVRFGYSKGLFITNVKISPQAKRDCLNDYPNYSVDFLEGDGIVKKVFDSLVLKAIWYDGQSLDEVLYTLNFPLILRDLETDKPLQLLPQHTEAQTGNKIVVGRSEIQIMYQRSNTSTSVFGEYRSPRRKTPGELGSTHVGVTEAILSGIIHMGDIDQILVGLREETISQIHKIHKDKKHFALLLGQPSLTPLGGQSTGARVELEDIEPITYVDHGDFQGEEVDWIIPSQSTEWVLPRSPSVSQADWIRWYNQQNDICFDVMVLSHPGDRYNWQLIEQRDYFVKWWNQSLFMLVPHEVVKNWNSSDIPEPTDWHEWNDTYSLGIWLHPVFNIPIAQMAIEPEYSDLEPDFMESDLEKAKKELDEIRQKLEVLDSTFVEPEKARHMVAILTSDPYPNTELVICPGKQLAYYLSMVPTPIDPGSRRFQFTACWEIKPMNDIKFSKAGIGQILSTLRSYDYSPFHTNFYLDDEIITNDTFILLEIEFNPENRFQCTEHALIESEEKVMSLVEDVEKILNQLAVYTRSTRRYWDKELLMLF